MCRFCTIVPPDVLLRLSKDKSLSDATRQNLAEGAKVDVEFRKLRIQALKLTRLAPPMRAGMAPVVAAPAITVYDCQHSASLPGTPVPNPGSASDATAKRAFDITTAVAQFYKSAFNRNSIDDAGMTMMSSVHYRTDFNNAFWTGQQMVYGDGDGKIFIDFTKGNDVVGHELTHGVTQHSLELNYTNEAGGLNESMSDVVGSMFRQWQAGQDAAQADWLIGKDIMGPDAIAKGYTCLRDMASPGAAHCLAPQPFHFSKYKKGMDPHYSSGIPNFAFCKIAKAIGGKSWDKAGQIWYKSMIGFGSSPNMKMSSFANRTRQVATSMFAGNTAVINAVDQGWKQVGL